jgi:hypothetical protein
VEAMSTVVVDEKRLEAAAAATALASLRPRDTQLRHISRIGAAPRARGCRHRLGHVGNWRGGAREGGGGRRLRGEAWGGGEGERECARTPCLAQVVNFKHWPLFPFVSETNYKKSRIISNKMQQKNVCMQISN